MTTHRLAALSDLDAIHAIYMDDSVIPFLGVDPMPKEAFSSVLKSLIDGGNFYVAEDRERIQGFYRMSRHEGRARHVAYLGTLAIAPHEQGTGLAAAIVNHAIDTLKADGVLRVELMLEADNPRAFKFYKKLGFEHEGTLRAAYKRANQAHYVDELLMAKLLLP